MIIDCDSCEVRGVACHDCVVAVLIGPPAELAEGIDDGAVDAAVVIGGATPWSADERRALGVLAQAGLVPPLRLASPASSPASRPASRPVTNDTPSPGRRAV